MCNVKDYIILTLLFMIQPGNSYSQTNSDLDIYKDFSQQFFIQPDKTSKTINILEDRPVMNTLKVFHRFYKSFIGSQDAGHCPFQTSCSYYFMGTIAANGIFLGVLDGTDRLMRCNGLNNDMYRRNDITGKLIDEIPNLKSHYHE